MCVCVCGYVQGGNQLTSSPFPVARKVQLKLLSNRVVLLFASPPIQVGARIIETCPSTSIAYYIVVDRRRLWPIFFFLLLLVLWGRLFLRENGRHLTSTCPVKRTLPYSDSPLWFFSHLFKTLTSNIVRERQKKGESGASAVTSTNVNVNVTQSKGTETKTTSQVQMDSPPLMESIVGTANSRMASPTTASALPALLHLQVPPASTTSATKKSNFSISNLLATEEQKKTSDGKHARLSERDENRDTSPEINHQSKAVNDRIVIQQPSIGSPFINASALAHLAHLHHGSNAPTSSSSSNSASAMTGWPDWLGTAGLAPDAHQSLWSR